MIQLRPSSSSIWANCAAMPRFAATLPEPEPTDPAREGTCAAWVAEMVLTGQAERASDMIGASHENGWLVDSEMVHHIQNYVDLLRSRGGRIIAESFVRLNEMIAGTPDAIAVVDDEGVLYGDDLKYGYSPVDPYRNTQVSIYVAAVLATLNVPIKNVVIGIYQPRSMHPDGIYRKWETTPAELMKFVEWIKERGHECQDTESVATPGRHCEYCPAAASCTALAQSVYSGFDVMRSTRQTHLDGKKLAQELDFLKQMEKMVKARVSAIESETIARMSAGDYIPGWGMEERVGKRKFTASPTDIALATGIDPYEEQKLCTPAELERRGAPKEIVARMSTQPRISPKLTKRGDDHFKRLFEGK